MPRHVGLHAVTCAVSNKETDHGGAYQDSRSLLQTCQVNRIDGYRYLRALFVALPKARTADDYAQLLPWRIDLAAA